MATGHCPDPLAMLPRLRSWIKGEEQGGSERDGKRLQLGEGGMNPHYEILHMLPWKYSRLCILFQHLGYTGVKY